MVIRKKEKRSGKERSGKGKEKRKIMEKRGKRGKKKKCGRRWVKVRKGVDERQFPTFFF